MRGQMDAGNTSLKRPAGVPSGKFFEILVRELFVGEAPRFNRGNKVLCSCGGQPTKRIKAFYKVAPPRQIHGGHHVLRAIVIAEICTSGIQLSDLCRV